MAKSRRIITGSWYLSAILNALSATLYDCSGKVIMRYSEHHVEVSLRCFSRKAGGWACPHYINNNKGSFCHSSLPYGFLHKGKATSACCAHSPCPCKRCSYGCIYD